MQTQGSLSQQVVPEILKAIGLNAPGAVLTFQVSNFSKQLFLEKGAIVFGISNAPEDDFGEFLVRIGKIPPAQLDEAIQANSSHTHTAKLLLDRGVLDKEQSRQLLEMATAEWIYGLFDCIQGTFALEANKPLPVDDSLKINLSIPDLLLEGTRRLKNMDIIHRGLRGDEQLISHTPQYETILNSLALNSNEAFILSRVDSSIAVGDILRLSPLGVEMTKRTLYGLLLAGVLQFAIPPQAPKTASRAGARKEEVRRDSRSKPPVAGPTPEPPPKKSAAPDVDTDFIRADVLRKLEEVKIKSYYEMLNVPMTASSDEIKKAYYSLAKKYHPDHYHQPELANLKSTLDMIFAELAKAYDTLKVPAARASYDTKLQETKEANAPPTQAAAPAHVSVDVAGQQRVAELSFRQGRGLYDNKDYWSAIQAFRQSVRLCPEAASYRYWLAMALSQNPKWRREAEEHFLKAIELEQFNVTSYIGIALMYKEAGLPKRAESYLHKALQVAPGNKSVQEILGQLKPAEKGVKGLKAIANLFKKK